MVIITNIIAKSYKLRINWNLCF